MLKTKYLDNNFGIFFFYWLVTFVLYLPAAHSGLEGDFPYWVLSIKEGSFWDFINTKTSALPILYQFTQLVRYFVYSVFGVDPWLWHLLHITLHAVICLLFFRICKKILKDSNIEHPYLIAFFGVLLFCVTPHATEVIVRELCFHYLQGFIFILLIFGCLLRFMDSGKSKYAWVAGIIYLISAFSLEIFYLTPWLVLLLAAYYRIVLQRDRATFRKSLLCFFIPELSIFLSHLALLRILWGNTIAHIGVLSLKDPTGLLNKPILYFFHILFLGRYFPQALKQQVYSFFDSGTVVMTFYVLIILLLLVILLRFRKITVKSKLILLFSAMSVSFVLLATPLDFATILLVIGDRYIYIPSAFTSIIFALIVSGISYRPLAIGAFSLYFLLNVYFTVQTNISWYYSAKITKRLLTDIPEAGGKKILLLNLPSNINGALMIRAHSPSEFKIMNNLFVEKNKVKADVYDVSAYNMISPHDGAHVTVINDSVLHVTLNQWGTWWWYEDLGAGSYSNDAYKVNMIDAGHWYELTLKHPADEYLILYEVGDKWKTVDWNQKNADQN